MTGRQRVFSILNGQKPDRMPFFLIYDAEVAAAIAKAHGINEDEILDYYDSDMVHIPAALSRTSVDANTRKDIFGVTWRTGIPVPIDHPLSQAERVVDLENYPWPDESVLDIAASFDSAQKAHKTGRAVCGGVWASIFTGARNLLGEEKFLCGVYENPELIHAVVNRMTDSYIKINTAYFTACREVCDIFYFGSDFGTQNSMFLSPEMFDEFFAPYMKQLANSAKKFDKQVMFHTCGSIVSIIDSLIDCGIDILNPVQVSATGMSPKSLADRFKGRIAFHGGISSQTTFTTGTPDMVYAETQNTIETLGPFGYIPAPDQELIGAVTAENIDAFVKAVKEYRFK